MKKFLLSILVVITFATVASSQSLMTQTDPAGASATVNTNADTSYHKVDLAGQTFNYKYLTMTVAGTKSSGTIVGVVTLWGSNDNSRWFPAYASKDGKLADTTTSQALTDGDTDLLYILSGTKFRYYQLRVITAGTQVSSYACRILGRKQEN